MTFIISNCVVFSCMLEFIKNVSNSYDKVTFDHFPIFAILTFNIEQNINVTNNTLIAEFVNWNQSDHNSIHNYVNNVEGNLHKIHLCDILY